MRFKGVSVVISIVLLIMIAVALGGALILFIPLIKPSESIEVDLSLEYRGDNLILNHEGGRTIKNAFVLDDGAIQWKNLEVRINGKRENVGSGATLNGDNNVGLTKFKFRDELKFPILLNDGDEIGVVYLPTDQILLSLRV